MKTLCVHCLVTGKVQGVWYRSNTKKKAKQLGLTGWVKNCQNGQVELVACGPEESITELCDWLWVGPNGANVNNVQIETIEPQHFSNFTVNY